VSRFFLLKEAGYTFFKSHVHEYWLLTRLPFVLFPLIALTVNLSVISAILLYSLYQLYWERAYIDELTGIPNRRSLNERLKRTDGSYSVAMIDIDHFKNMNDTYGHREGDNVLKFLAAHMGRVFGDTVFRYGGEEF